MNRNKQFKKELLDAIDTIKNKSFEGFKMNCFFFVFSLYLYVIFFSFV